MDNSLIFLNACKNGQKGVVQAFIKKGGIDFNKRDTAGNTPLFYACMKGARDIVKLLLDNGTDPGIANNANLTPLHAISQSGNKDITAMLVEAGADVNATDNEGKTALMSISPTTADIKRLTMQPPLDCGILFRCLGTLTFPTYPATRRFTKRFTTVRPRWFVHWQIRRMSMR